MPDRSGPGCCTRCALAQTLDADVKDPNYEALFLGDIPIVGSRIGHVDDYEILGVIARGGMGVVYKAHQKALNRTVALKLLIAGVHASDEFKLRFKHEAETSAKLEHPNIVPIFEVGEHEGQPYFAMAYVPGPNLERLLEHKPLPVKKAVEYARILAETVSFAHDRGVLHRDLKPSNILVGIDGRLQITDFGLARDLNQDSGCTVDGVAIGTPDYMAPEQALGSTRDLTVAVDVWSLGVILFQMLTGQVPLHADTPFQTARRVIEAEPPRPSSLNNNVDRDLETICLKCLEKDPKRRYASARELADDLHRWQKHEPVYARRASAPERGVKYLRRHPMLAALTGFVILSILGFVMTLALNQANLRRERRVAEVRLAEALASEGQNLAAHQEFAKAKAKVWESWSIFSSAKVSPLPAELRLFDIYRKSPPPLLTLRGHAGKVTCARVRPGTRSIVSGGEDGTIRMWSLPLARQEAAWNAHLGGVTSLAISPDGMRCVSGGTNGEVKIWDLRSLLMVKTIDVHRAPVSSLCFAPTGDLFASASRDRTIRFWNTSSGEENQVINTGDAGITAITFSPDGERLVQACTTEGLAIWSVRNPTNVARFDVDQSCLCATFTVDGKAFLRGDARGVLLQRETARGLAVAKGEMDSEVTALAVLPDGKKALSGGKNGTICLWDLLPSARNRFLTFSEHEDAVRDLAILEDGRLAVSASEDGTIRIWDTCSEQDPFRFGPQVILTSRAQFSPDGQMVLSAGLNGALNLWDVATGNLLIDFEGHSEILYDAAFSPDARRIVSAGRDGTLRLWNVADGRELRTFMALSNSVSCCAFLPEGKEIIAGEGPPRAGIPMPAQDQNLSRLHVFELETGREIRSFPAHEGGVFVTVCSSNNQSVLSGGGDGWIRVWDPRTWSELRSFKADDTRVNSLVVTPDGERCVSVGTMRTLRFWDLRTGTEIRSITGLRDEARSVDISSDGSLLAAGLDNGSLTFWDVQSARELLSFDTGQNRGLRALSFAAQGRRVAFGCAGSTLALWDLDRVETGNRLKGAADKAQALLQKHPNDRAALKALAEYYEFRRIWDWAAELYEQAVAQGEDVENLSVARCLWKAGRLERAYEAIGKAETAREAPAHYLRLCQTAIRRQLDREQELLRVDQLRDSHLSGTNRPSRMTTKTVVLQPGPFDSKDIWTESTYSHAPGGETPGGGLNNFQLRVGGWGDEQYSLLQFDLSHAPTNASAAVLSLYCHRLIGGGLPMYLDRITQPWDWRTSGTGRDRERLWWDDKPPASQWRKEPLPLPMEGDWYDIDITDLYNAWQSGALPNYGVQLRPAPFINEKFNEFYSADYMDDPSLRPKLVITPSP